MGNEIMPKSFYGTMRFAAPALAPGKGQEAALKAIRKLSRVYREFPSQQQAFDFCDRNTGSLQVWAYEIDSKGRRKFVAASYETFWRMYSRSIRYGKKLHFYEVIRERRASKLYFDLEYQKQPNPDVNPEKMIDALVDACAQLSKSSVSRDGGDVLEMDSTTEKKFSRHLVFEYIAFHDNLQVGDFARRVVEHLNEKTPDLVMVRKEDGQVTPFVDLGVYTKNRCFRLAGSSKFGKVQRLLPTKQKSNQYVSLSKQFFLQSLVCFLRPDVTLLGAVSPLSDSLQVKVENNGMVVDKYRSQSSSSATSPFPEVDQYVHSIIRPHGGGIYGVTIFSSSETVMYTIKGGYKYCANIGRHHKSNNVILLADLHRGEMFQRCFDPDCRGFRSRPWALPPHLRRIGSTRLPTYIDEGISDDCLWDFLDEMESQLSPQIGQGCGEHRSSYIDEAISDNFLSGLLDKVESQANTQQESLSDLDGGINDDMLNAAMDDFLTGKQPDTEKVRYGTSEFVS